MSNSKKTVVKRKDVFDNSTDDFESPIHFKKFKSSSNFTSTKRSKKKKSKDKKQLTLHQVYEENFRYTDVNADHLQLALALSRSISEENSCSKEEFPMNFSKDGKKKTLLEFGFKTDRPKMGVENKILRREPLKTNKKSKFRYITPVLMMRTEEERESLIQSKLSELLMGQTEVSSSGNDVESLPIKVSSEELEKLRCPDCSVFQLNTKIILSDDEKFVVPFLEIERAKTKSGSLLKDWKKIPLRDHTPENLKTNYMDAVLEKKPEVYSQNLDSEKKLSEYCSMESIESNVIESNNKHNGPIGNDDFDYLKNPKQLVGCECDGSVSPDLFESDISYVENVSVEKINNSSSVRKNLNEMFTQERIIEIESNLINELPETIKGEQYSNSPKNPNELQEKSNPDITSVEVIVLNPDQKNDHSNDEDSRLFINNTVNFTSDTMLNFQKFKAISPVIENSSLKCDYLKNYEFSDSSESESNNCDVISESRSFFQERKHDNGTTDVDNILYPSKSPILTTECTEVTSVEKSNYPFFDINKFGNEYKKDCTKRSKNFYYISDEELDDVNDNADLNKIVSNPGIQNSDIHSPRKVSYEVNSLSNEQIDSTTEPTHSIFDEVNFHDGNETSATKEKSFEGVDLGASISGLILDEKKNNSFNDIKLRTTRSPSNQVIVLDSDEENSDNHSREKEFFELKNPSYTENIHIGNERDSTDEESFNSSFCTKKTKYLDCLSNEETDGPNELAKLSESVFSSSNHFGNNKSGKEHHEMNNSIEKNRILYALSDEVDISGEQINSNQTVLSSDTDTEIEEKLNSGSCYSFEEQPLFFGGGSKNSESGELLNSFKSKMTDSKCYNLDNSSHKRCFENKMNSSNSQFLEDYSPSRNNCYQSKYFSNNEKQDFNQFLESPRSSMNHETIEQFSRKNMSGSNHSQTNLVMKNSSDFNNMNNPGKKTVISCNTPLRRYASFSIEGSPRNSTVFAKQKSESEITPNSKLIIKTKNVTPMTNYQTLSTPEIIQELGKFGLKPLKRKRGINLLRHIYESTHPKVEMNAKCDEQSSGWKRRKSNDRGKNESDCIHHSPVKTLKDLSKTISESDAIFERHCSSKIASCQVPLQIVWHNFLNENPPILENILLYEPLQVEVIHKMLKELGFKFHIQDLIAFLDQKCITIRVAQSQQSKLD